jgi:hypothetical protein
MPGHRATRVTTSGMSALGKEIWDRQCPASGRQLPLASSRRHFPVARYALDPSGRRLLTVLFQEDMEASELAGQIRVHFEILCNLNTTSNSIAPIYAMRSPSR